MVFLLETRCSGKRAENSIKRCGFNFNDICEARGFLGGIWAMWNHDVTTKCIQKHNQFIQFEFEDQKKEKWGIIAVYANPHLNIRSKLWPEIEEICSNSPCLFIVAARRPIFTWEGPRRPNQEKLYKRLDRVLCTAKWSSLFAEASTKCLTRTHSDHHPILIDTDRKEGNAQNRPFRFEMCWMQHKEFTNFLTKAWDKRVDHQQMLDLLTMKLKEWNKDTFGDLKQRKNILTRRLHGTQSPIDRSYNPFLEKLGRELKNELEDVLNQEEELWFQKARCMWIREGNRNTKYYHTKAIARRRRNKITMLKNQSGDWTENKEEIKSIILDYYMTLFKEDQPNREVEAFPSCWPQIEQITWDRGLGFRSLHEMNKAFLYKLAWQLVNNKDALWVRIIKANYGCSSKSGAMVPAKSTDSRLWKEILKFWPDFYKNIVWEMGNGQDIDMWHDQWVPNTKKLEDVSYIWLWRNKSLKEDDFKFPDDPGRVILNYAKIQNQAWETVQVTPSLDKIVIKEAWLKPEYGWVKVNTDGAVWRNSNIAGCGGLIRDHHGAWIKGFMRNIGISSPVGAEA
ncbi:ribonuclease H [Senna tora]|uniref:Ribonuclease H n=1 Tax=Senna tora TaxID=362788 RepID=A0A835CFQ5_9FABA|nr:ribonuclease H [Senna tora]